MRNPRKTASLLIVLCSLQPLLAEGAAEKNAEADYFFFKHSFVSWAAAPVSWYRGLQNGRALNTLIGGSLQTPYLDGSTTVNTGKAVTIGLATGQSTSMVSAGPSRVSAALEYIDSEPGVGSQSSATSNTSTRGSILDLGMSERLRHYALTYDHELHFASSSSALYGLGLWLGMSVSYDEYKAEQFRLSQSASVSASGSSNSTIGRNVKSYFFTTPTVLGVAYRKTLTDRLILDVRGGFQTDAYGEAKITYKGDGLSQSVFSGTALNLPAVIKGQTRADLAGSTGYLWTLGTTFKLTDSIAVRAHVEDRMMRYKVEAYVISPDAGALTGGLLNVSSSNSTAFFSALLPDLGPLPAEITDRRRSCGLELQFWF
jgi:hypothetical protein